VAGGRTKGIDGLTTGERSPDGGWPAVEEQEEVLVLPLVSDIFNEGTLGGGEANRAQKLAASRRERRAESREETLV
jgi:hypothetical protein